MTTLESLAKTTECRTGARAGYEAWDREWRAEIRRAVEAGNSQQEVAAVAGITQGRVAQIVAGRR